MNADERRSNDGSLSAFIGVHRRPGLFFELAVLWFAGTAMSLVQMALAWITAVRIRRKARPFPGISIKGVPVLESAPGSMPMTFGLTRLAILLPSDAADWSEERRRVVLWHELAHVRRGDAGSQLLARAALSLYWWNPLLWLAWRQFLRERERAADDIVLNGGARPSDYAAHLLEIARAVGSSPAARLAAVAMAHNSPLEARLRAILDSQIDRGAPRRAAGWIAVLATIVLIAPIAALRAQDPQTVPADVDATIRAAAAQKNHQMLDGAAQAAEAYRQYDLARRLLDSSLAIRAEASGQGSVDYGIGLLKLGDLERDRKNLTEAEAFYSKAVSVLAGRPGARTALIDLGLLAMGPRKDLPRAIDYFERAQTADPAKAGPALMWMALARQQQGHSTEAEQLYKQALALDVSSRDAATARQLYAILLRGQGREEEANVLKTEAESIITGLARKAPQFRQRSGVIPSRVGNGVTAPALVCPSPCRSCGSSARSP